MSTTSNIQNLLVNVFRPAYTYDTVSNVYRPKLELSNVDTYFGNAVTVLRANVGDARSNVYVGIGSGNDPTVSIQACSNVTAVGYNAGNAISNVSNSVYLGFNAGAGAASAVRVIAIGENAIGNGTSNIYIGSATGSAGSNNTFIGHGIAPGVVNNQFRIGVGSNILIGGDFSNKWVGIGTSSPLSNNVGYSKFDVSGSALIQGNLGINVVPGGRTLDVNGNFRVSDSVTNIFDVSGGVASSSGGFVSTRSSIATSTGGGNSLGAIKRGHITVSAIDQTTSANRAFASIFAYTSTAATIVTSDFNGNASITISVGGNIELVDGVTGDTYDYTVTYFPLP